MSYGQNATYHIAFKPFTQTWEPLNLGWITFHFGGQYQENCKTKMITNLKCSPCLSYRFPLSVHSRWTLEFCKLDTKLVGIRLVCGQSYSFGYPCNHPKNAEKSYISLFYLDLTFYLFGAYAGNCKINTQAKLLYLFCREHCQVRMCRVCGSAPLGHQYGATFFSKRSWYDPSNKLKVSSSLMSLIHFESFWPVDPGKI